MNLHHRMAADIRALLKSTMKYDEDNQLMIREYLLRYKHFLDTIGELHGNVLSKDFTENVVRETIKQLDEVLKGLMEVYDDLMEFEKIFGQKSVSSTKKMLKHQAESYSIEVAAHKRGWYKQAFYILYF